MGDAKNYLTVSELQQICQKFGLSSEGLKHELIKRILDFTSIETLDDIDSKNSQPTNVSRVCYTRTRIIPSEAHESSDLNSDDQPEPIQSTQTLSETKTSKLSFQFDSLFLKFVIVILVIFIMIGILGGCVSIYHQFGNIEVVEIPVKRSWFHKEM